MRSLLQPLCIALLVATGVACNDGGPELLQGDMSGADAPQTSTGPNGSNAANTGADGGFNTGDGANTALGDPTMPGDPGDPSDPGNPGDPGSPGDPGNPGDPGDPGNPGNPGDPGDPGDPPPPRGPAEILVYTANVENLPRTSDGCPGDWQDLFAYMAVQARKPDIFFVQQVTDAAQLATITGRMTASLGRPYEGIIAEANPTPFNSPCGAQKEKQTNAVVWATDRLQRSGEPHIWQSYKNVNDTCVLDTLSRTRGIASAFRDATTGETIGAASIHWSTRNGGGPDPACAVANARHTDQVFRVHFPSASFWVFGGDTNEPDTESYSTSAAYTSWYREINGGVGNVLGYQDPVWERCSVGSLRQCLLDNWTFDGNTRRRIDFLFARGATLSVVDAHTITFNEAGAADQQLTGSDSNVGYSDHRAVWSVLRY